MKKQYILILIACVILSGKGISAAPQPIPAIIKAASVSDYQKKEQKLHTRIFGMFPGLYVDSLSIANHLLNDSLRKKIAANRDSVVYLKACLDNSLKDSITLNSLAKLVTDETQLKYNPSGIWIIHCKDALTAVPLDSVMMNVFSGNKGESLGLSDKNGDVKIKGLPEHSYYVVFTRRGYEPFTFKNIKVPNGKQLYIEVQLSKQEYYICQLTKQDIELLSGAIGILVILFTIFILVYRFIKRRKKKNGNK